MNRLTLSIVSSVQRTLPLSGSTARRSLNHVRPHFCVRHLAPPKVGSLQLRSAWHSTTAKSTSTAGTSDSAAGIAQESDKETVSGQFELESADHERRFLIAFTCKVCNTRQSKLVTHHAYDKGVVLARCDGCQNVHLISDNKNWFMEGRNVEEIVQKQDPTQQIQKLSFRAKDAQSQAYLERLLKEDPALMDRLARAKIEAMQKAQAAGGTGGEAVKATVKVTVPTAAE